MIIIKHQTLKMSRRKNDYSDLGKKIPYAKKDLAEPRSANESQATLKSLWPEPDWEKWCRKGVDVNAVAHMHQYYHGLRTKPRAAFTSDVTDKMWSTAYVIAIKHLEYVFQTIRTMDDLKKAKESFRDAMGVPKINGVPKLAEVYSLYAAGRGDGKTFKTPYSMTTRASKLARLLPKLDWPFSVNHTEIRLFPVRLQIKETTKVSWSLCSIKGKNIMLRQNSEKYTSEEDAIIALKKLIKNKVKFKEPRKKLDGMKNVSRGYRKIQPERLIKEFGFRGLQYGNSLPDKERAVFVDNTYYSFVYLARILNIPKRWVGLNGVGLAFGARGTGGSAAHYEPALNVINFTRHNGPGSGAHEWFHAFDSLLATLLGHKDRLLSETSDHYLNQNKRLTEKLKHFRAMQEVITDKTTNYYSNATSISAQSGARKYWHTECELMARAFEAYIQDSLQNIKIRETDWLAYGTKEQDSSLSDQGMNPYPCDEERQRFNKVIEHEMAFLWS